MEERCRACGVTIVSSQEMDEILERVLRGDGGRLNVADRPRLNDNQAAPVPDVEGQALLFGGSIPTQLRVFSILLVLLLLPAIAAASRPASWPDEWTAYLIPDETYIDAVWSDPANAYRAPIEAGTFLRGDAIAGGLMHAHVLSGPYDLDLGDWRQRDQSFCLSRAPAGDLGLDMMQFPFDTSGVYMPTCLGSGNVPEPAAIAAAAGGILLFKRRRARP